MTAFRGAVTLDRDRLVTIVALVASAALIVAIVGEIVEIATNLGRLAFPLDGDRVLYANAARDWLAGRGFYESYQLAGPYDIRSGDILYPPPMLLVFAPLAALPDAIGAVLYYAIPLGITAAAVVWLRPSVVGWPAILFCLWWPTTIVVIAGGNPGIWLMAFMALGCLWRPLSVLVFLKPTLAPFAFFGANRRSWWIALAILAVVSLAFLPLWPEFVRASLNARGGGGIFYSIGQAPMLLLPLAAWATSSRRRASARSRSTT
jgi:glycosyl transferase family 87